MLPFACDERLGPSPRVGRSPGASAGAVAGPGAALLASATAMADVQPLRALHYEPSVVGPLAEVVAPPYDVIDADQRAQLIRRSPFNVVPPHLPRANPDPYPFPAPLFHH